MRVNADEFLPSFLKHEQSTATIPTKQIVGLVPNPYFSSKVVKDLEEIIFSVVWKMLLPPI